MKHLVRNITFKSGYSSLDLSNKILAYFSRPGFKCIQNDISDFTFKNESFLLSSWSFNPLSWKSKVQITIEGEIVKAHFLLHLEGQEWTPKMLAVWDQFILDFQSCISGNKVDQAGLQEAIKLARFSGWALVVKVLVVASLAGAMGFWINLGLDSDVFGILLMIISVHLVLKFTRNKAVFLKE